MIATWLQAVLGFVVASCVFPALGWPLAVTLAPAGVPPLAIAPALGWAIGVTLALPVLTLTGFYPGAIDILFAAGLLAAGLCSLRRKAAAALPVWTVPFAASLALLPAMAIMPKAAPEGVLLAPPMFDHVKIAVVDAILRTGAPATNPFYGPGGDGHLSYYYLWHTGAAMLAGGLHVNGWSAEAAMTGFTAFASLLLIIGLVMGLGGRTIGIVAAALLSLPGSLRPLLIGSSGDEGAGAIIPRGADIGAWLNQSAWVPQHLASASSAILACLLMLRVARGGGWLAMAALGVTAASSFESSIWVGGIGFAAIALCVGAWLFASLPDTRRWGFLARAAGSASVTVALTLPFIVDDLHAVQARQVGSGIAFGFARVFGAGVPAGWVLNPAAFWLVLLPFSMPAVMPLGAASLWSRRREAAGPARDLLLALGVAAGACLCVAWLFRSTIDNNDLGWRVVLPAMLVFTALAGCAIERLAAGRRWLAGALALGVAVLGVPDTVRMVGEYARGQLPGDPAGYAASEPLWQAVRRHAGPLSRVASNPGAAGHATPWPVNIAWATLSDRPSCFAGWASVIAYGAIPKTKLFDIDTTFRRVFEGHAQPGDVSRLAKEEDCAVAALTPADGAWLQDPFRLSAEYRLVEAADAWKIYARNP